MHKTDDWDELMTIMRKYNLLDDYAYTLSLDDDIYET